MGKMWMFIRIFIRIFSPAVNISDCQSATGAINPQNATVHYRIPRNRYRMLLKQLTTIIKPQNGTGCSTVVTVVVDSRSRPIRSQGVGNLRNCRLRNAERLRN